MSREVAGDARETNALNLTVEELGRVRAEYQHARAATPSHLAPTWTQVTDTAYSSLLIDAVLMVCALAIQRRDRLAGEMCLEVLLCRYTVSVLGLLYRYTVHAL